jgi:hypothetical protein
MALSTTVKAACQQVLKEVGQLGARHTDRDGSGGRRQPVQR